MRVMTFEKALDSDLTDQRMLTHVPRTTPEHTHARDDTTFGNLIGRTATLPLHRRTTTSSSSGLVVARLATMKGLSSLAPKTKNLIVAGGLSGFVLGVYYYTMRAVGGTDELQVAIDKFEQMKNK
ncbi:unnamed protein product [Musa acuminata subsp. burmannicoides]